MKKKNIAAVALASLRAEKLGKRKVNEIALLASQASSAKWRERTPEEREKIMAPARKALKKAAKARKLASQIVVR